MFSVSVRNHFMIAHSFKGEVFGPAQNMHGATYVVDAEFRRATLDENNIVVDIGRAGDALTAVLDGLNFCNLDEESAFDGENTTTEFLALTIFNRIKAKIDAGQLGPGSDGLVAMKITLNESHVAWAAYEAPLGN